GGPRRTTQEQTAAPATTAGAVGFWAASASSSLDRCPDQIPPFGPGAVVVLDLREAEQGGEHEPGVGGALADPTVRHDRVVLREPQVALVDLHQLRPGLEQVRRGVH